MDNNLHPHVLQVVEQITKIKVDSRRSACAALVAYLTQQQVADLILDREDLKLLVELAVIYSAEKEEDILTSSFYTALAGLDAAFNRTSRFLTRESDTAQHLEKVKNACDVIVGLFPFVAYEFSDSNLFIVRFTHGVSNNPLFTLLDWSTVKDVQGEYSVSVRFSPQVVTTENRLQLIPEKYLSQRFRWLTKGRRDRAWYCNYLSMGQLYDLLSSSPLLLKPDELH